MKNKSANNKLPLLLITEKREKITVTPQLVDHAHIDFCAAIGCNLVQLRRKMNVFISGRGHVAIASQPESQLRARCCMTLHGCRSRRSQVAVTIVNNA